jgi:hypothetical protein
VIEPSLAKASATDSDAAPAPKRRRNQRLLAASGVLVLIAAGAGAALIASHSSDGSSFPLTKPQATYTGFAVTTQAPDFFVGVDLSHPGSVIQVRDVQAHTSANVDFLGALTVWPRQIKKLSVGAGLGFPPADVLGTHPLREPVPAAETLFEPKGFHAPGPVTVVAGFRLRTGEIGAMNGIRVEYTVDGHRKTKDSPQAGIACLKPKCGGGATGSDSPEFDTRILREAGLLPKD